MYIFIKLKCNSYLNIRNMCLRLLINLIRDDNKGQNETNNLAADET